jgi:4'-phosphopantetheinyl transferase
MINHNRIDSRNAESIVMETVSLPADQIHIWHTSLQSLLENSNLSARYQSFLTIPELEQYRAFVFAKDQLRYLTTRALTRHLLARYTGIAAPALRFATTAYGRPYLKDGGLAHRVCFNISHTSDFVVLAIASERELGIDIESTSIRRAPIEIAERYFAPAEVRSLRALPERLQSERFWELWTLKESYIKARGKGLSLDLDTFSFDLATANALGFSAAPDDFAERWSFWQFRPDAYHVVALCAERRPGANTQLRFMRIVPLQEEEALTVVETRKAP